MWIYNEIEKNRDKNMFLFNFLREQYNSDHMQIMGEPEAEDDCDYDIPDGLEEDSEQDAELPPKITPRDLENAKKKLVLKERVAIAEANLIDGVQKKEIETRMENEDEVMEAELLSLQLKNLLDCYELDDFTSITSLFVKEYAPGKVREAFHNRKILKEKGLKQIMKEEGAYFNNVFEDKVEVQDDLAKKYKSMKFTVAIELVKIAGFSGLYSAKEMTKKKMMKNFKDNEELLINKMPRICTVIGRSKRHIPKIEEWGDKDYLKNMLKFINSILQDLFCLQIKKTAHRSGKYTMEGINMFTFDEDNILLFS